MAGKRRQPTGRNASSLEAHKKLTSDIGGLDVVLDLLDLLLELVERDLGILDDQVDLEHLDTVADGDELGGTPDKSVLLNSSDLLLHGLHVRLVVPGLDLERDDRLGDLEGLAGGKLLGRLCGLGLLVLGDTLGLDSLGLGVVLLVLTKEVNVVVVLLLGGRRGLVGLGGRRGRGSKLVGALGQGRVLRRVRGNVSEPSGSVGVRLGVGRGCGCQLFDMSPYKSHAGLLTALQGVVNLDIGRRGGVAVFVSLRMLWNADYAEPEQETEKEGWFRKFGKVGVFNV